MNITIYIDESGDFESNKGEWVVAGMLSKSDYKTTDMALNKYLKNFPEKIGLKEDKTEFHLTEFREKYGNKRALEIADLLYSELATTKLDTSIVSTVNKTKVRLGNKEKIYRVMLLDLLALSCLSVETEDIEQIDLIIATRTKDGELMTSMSDLEQNIFKTLPE